MKVARVPVFVEWVDSSGTNGWLVPDEIPDKAIHCETLGWLVKESAHSISVALNGAFDGSSSRPFGEVITIPKCAIVKRRKVKA